MQDVLLGWYCGSSMCKRDNCTVVGSGMCRRDSGIVCGMCCRDGVGGVGGE